ncbi:Lrp/AsnC family transcriptional regulator [Labrenzia sp. OB1]|uniref:Lrp/AsnC family transcriptional regulator n=1 Tax=Labrenzia sp. OB1 TaxID=1561204 RepID=UPI0007B252B7|nr:Lrp/AsnC family transcriptional regulator [Labrenzia sp. OB1]KZM50118.1 ArsR family transcriptional regulator [Labrenzia sp. OB1]
MDDDLDDANKTILRLMQQDRRIGLDVMAEECGLSIPSVQRRQKRLKESGIIRQEVAILDAARLDYNMTLIVLVELERESLQQLDMFRRLVRAEPQVQQCYYVTGDADFILICTARDMQDFEELTHRLFFENSNVRRFRTSVTMERTKVGLTLPI